MTHKILPSLSALCILAASQSGAVTFFNDQTAFDAATAAVIFTLDPFDNFIAGADPSPSTAGSSRPMRAVFGLLSTTAFVWAGTETPWMAMAAERR